jgi:hypothetical protein
LVTGCATSVVMSQYFEHRFVERHGCLHSEPGQYDSAMDGASRAAHVCSGSLEECRATPLAYRCHRQCESLVESIRKCQAA